MSKLNRILWGIVLILVGALFALNTLNITNINLFFDGWWTLFILVPCAIGLFTEREKTGNLIGIVIGVILLLCCRDILDFSLLWRLVVPALIVILGLKMVLTGIFSGKAGKILAKRKEEGKNTKTVFAAFSGNDVNYNGEAFEGANLAAVFGGVECDLRGASITEDCVIAVTVLFGGVDILVPEGINVKSNVFPLFGGTTNMTKNYKNAPTIYVNGFCLFGGAEIR